MARRHVKQTTGEVKDVPTAADLGRIEAAAGVMYQFGLSDISDGYLTDLVALGTSRRLTP